jgi:ABC-type Fe3+ transport system substrate-binding protein
VLSLLFFATSVVFAASEKSSWQVRWESVVAAAKKEGQVNIYGGEEGTHPEIIAEFNKEFSEIKVVTVTGHSQLVPRIVAERRAQKYITDLFIYGPDSARATYLAGFLKPLAPELILPEVVETSKWYGGTHHYGDPEGKYIFIFEGTPGSPSLAYNTQAVEPKDIASLWDILNAKWKGKIGFFNYYAGSVPTPMLIHYYNPDLGPKFLKRLFTEMKIMVSANRRQATDWLARGKFALCVMCRDVTRAQKQGLPVAAFGPNDIKEGGVLGGGNSSVMVLLNQSPNPNASVVFLNWYLSRRGQAVWQTVMNQRISEPSNSMRTDIPTDDVLPEAQRLESRQYRMVGYLDPKPVQKFYKDLVSQAEVASK